MEQPKASHSNWQTWPHLKWSFLHIQELLRTAEVPRGLGDPSKLDLAPTQLDLSKVPLPRWVGPRSVEALMPRLEADALLVMHQGQLVCERYFGGQTADTLHIVQSVTKSVAALLVGCEKELWEARREALTEKLLPELRGSGYEGATLVDLLDMTCVTNFSESYAGASELGPAGGADMEGLCIAMGWHPAEASSPSSGSRAPPTTRSFLRSLTRREGRKHGSSFDYQSATAECLAWALESHTKKRFEELLSERIWQHIGAEHPALLTVDSEGVGGVSGGLLCTARDLARLGLLLARWGVSHEGRPVIPRAFLEDTLKPDLETLKRYNSGDEYGLAYHNNFWIMKGDGPSRPPSLMAYGIHGQVLWVDPFSEVVVVKLGTSPHAMDQWEYTATMEALLAIRRTLVQGSRDLTEPPVT